jgi:hypothetical protein
LYNSPAITAAAPAATLVAPAVPAPRRDLRFRITREGSVSQIQADCVLSNAQLLWLSFYNPEYEFLSGLCRKPHAALRTQRVVDEDIALSLLSPAGQVLDVGGNSNRHAKLNRVNVWSARPCLIAGDAQRLEGASGLYCRHLAQDCQCVDFDTVLFVHSLYYLSKIDVCRLVLRARAQRGVAVVHDFTDSFFGPAIAEASIARVGSDIIMTVDGNDIPYRHPEPTWLNTGDSLTVDGSYVIWQRVRLGPGTLAYKFSVVDERPPHFTPPKTPTVVKQPAGPPVEVDLRGVLSRDKAMPYAANLLRMDRIEATGDEYLAWTNSVSLSVSKDWVGAVQTHLAGKPKDAHLFGTAVTFARRYGVQYNMKPADLARAIPFVASLAIAQSTRDDAQAYEQLAKADSRGWFARFMGVSYRRRMEESRDRAFSPSKPRRSTMFACAVGAIVVVLAKVVHTLVSKRRLSVVGRVWDVVMWLVGYLRRRHPMIAPVVPRPGNHLLNTIPRSDVCHEGRPIAPTAADATYRPGPLHEQVCTPRFGNVLVGFGVTNVAPCVSRSCHHNAEIAILNRGLMLTTHDHRTWGFFASWWENNRHAHLLGIEVERHEFSSWLQRFPPARRAQLLAARQNVENGTYPTRLDGDAKAFVKRENQLKVFEHGVDSFDPRLIQGQTDEHQVVTATWTYQFNKALAAIWGCRNPMPQSPVGMDFHELAACGWAPIVYASGMNAVQIGQWFDWAVQQKGPNYIVLGDDNLCIFQKGGVVYYVPLDFCRWDAHFHTDAHLMRLRLYDVCGLSTRHKSVRSALARQSRVVGRTRFGQKYSVAGTVQSGVSDTSSANSHLNGMMTTFASEAVDLPNSLDFASYSQVLTDLGFPPEGMLSEFPELADFCSGLFMPSSTGTRLTPKPGRLLAKVFYCTEDLKPLDQQAWLRGVAVGLYPAIAHVPFVGAVFKRVLDLTAGITPKPYKLPPQYLGLPCSAATEETYDYFAARYGLTRTELANAESAVATVSELPFGLSDIVSLTLAAVDTDTPFSFLHALCRSLHSLIFQSRRAIFHHFYSLILAPYLEERLKRYSRFFLVLIPFIETIDLIVHRAPWPSILLRPAIHLLLARLPFRAAVGVHMILNLWVTMANAAIACFLKEVQAAAPKPP